MHCTCQIAYVLYADPENMLNLEPFNWLCLLVTALSHSATVDCFSLDCIYEVSRSTIVGVSPSSIAIKLTIGKLRHYVLMISVIK